LASLLAGLSSLQVRSSLWFLAALLVLQVKESALPTIYLGAYFFWVVFALDGCVALSSSVFEALWACLMVPWWNDETFAVPVALRRRAMCCATSVANSLGSSVFEALWTCSVVPWWNGSSAWTVVALRWRAIDVDLGGIRSRR